MDPLKITQYINGAKNWIEFMAGSYTNNPSCEFKKLTVDVEVITEYKISEDGENIVFWTDSGKERFFNVEMIGSIKNDGETMISDPDADQVYTFFAKCKGFEMP